MADTPQEQKRRAAEAAVDQIEAGMIVGLGTGSTAAFAIAALGRRVAEGLTVTTVATSLATEQAARAAGITVLDFADIAAIDLAIDGADEIDPGFRAIKGAGGALLREKIVATAADRMIAIVDASKRVARIGAARVPVEYWRDAHGFVERELRTLGAAPDQRLTGVAPYLTDLGNPVFDCAFAAMPDPAVLDRALSAIPGVFGHGLFLTQIDAAYVADDQVVTRLERGALPG